jgi:peptidoglycan/LPS O-acetylase OafA/YrhL
MEIHLPCGRQRTTAHIPWQRSRMRDPFFSMRILRSAGFGARMRVRLRGGQLQNAFPSVPDVLLVVFNHLQFRHFEGGFVGVDVFFVISGYLIGTSLLAEFSRGTFSLTSFYERRIRRIFPALLVMLLIVSGLAYRFLMPEAMVAYAGSLVAAVLSFSNFLFWHQTGYFADASAAKPLLHTWSLAVEEQFYVFFPLLLFCVFRWCRRQLRAILWAVATITFALAVWFTGFDASTAFFWSPLRAWELLAGVLISQHPFEWFRFRGVREVATLGGLLLIVLPGVRYTPQTSFPGWTTLFPCLGAAFIIAAGRRGGLQSRACCQPIRCGL